MELFRQSAPSVVHIFSQPLEQMSAAYDDDQQSQRTGSGFVWDKAGHIVTNEHVVRGADLVRVRLADGELRQGRVVGRAASFDLAVVKIEGRDLPGALPIPPSGSASPIPCPRAWNSPGERPGTRSATPRSIPSAASSAISRTTAPSASG